MLNRKDRISLKLTSSKMKKYQLWLERKSYSQHLQNLMKIKHSRYPSGLCESHTILRTAGDQNIPMHKNGETDCMRNSVDKLGDVIYCITEKQKKNCKIRVVKSFQILSDNINMARRIQEAKPVVDTNRQKSSAAFGKRRIFQKKCQLSNNQIREKNFKQFMRWQNKKTTHFSYRSQLKVEVKSISRVWKSQFMGMWCEVKIKKGWARSELANTNQFAGGSFNFLMDEQLSDELILRIFTCKGLNSEMIGEFRVSKPEAGEESSICCKSEDRRTQVQMKIIYSSIRRVRPVLNLK